MYSQERELSASRSASSPSAAVLSNQHFVNNLAQMMCIPPSFLVRIRSFRHLTPSSSPKVTPPPLPPSSQPQPPLSFSPHQPLSIPRFQPPLLHLTPAQNTNSSHLYITTPIYTPTTLPRAISFHPPQKIPLHTSPTTTTTTTQPLSSAA